MTSDLDIDPVSTGIREWQKVRDAANDALQRCKAAEEETKYYKGQYDAIATACKNLETRNQKLMEENAEFKMLLSDLGNRFLDVLQKSKVSPFRPAGSRPANGLDARAAREPLQRPQPLDGQSDELESSLRDIAKQINLDKAKSA
jgi:hypothetical protein